MAKEIKIKINTKKDIDTLSKYIQMNKALEVELIFNVGIIHFKSTHCVSDAFIQMHYDNVMEEVSIFELNAKLHRVFDVYTNGIYLDEMYKILNKENYDKNY